MSRKHSVIAIQAPKFVCLLALSLLLVFDSSSWAKERASEESSPVRITVRVFNYAEVASRVLEEGQKEASKIFRKAGVETTWVDCQVTAEKKVANPACHEPLGQAEFALRILPRTSAVPPGLRDNIGFAFLPPEGRGSMAGIFYDLVESLAGLGRASRGVVLAHALAHEIGHLLLGTSAHSPWGLMRGGWVKEELRQAAMGNLLFTPEQAEQIRADVLERVSGQDMSRAAQANAAE